jgi:hypothetical protein
MVLTVSFALSPVIGLFCHRHQRIISANLTPASRRQDHTTSPSAISAFVKGAANVHRISSRVPRGTMDEVSSHVRLDLPSH